jgi:transposase
LIAEARIKTDRLSAEALARLLQANFICEVWVPDEQTREQRALVSHRVFLSRNSTRFKNRIHSVLHRYQLRMPQGLDLFSPTGKDWLLAQKLSDFDRLQVENCFDLLFSLQQSQKKVDKALALAARQDKRAAILMQIPGIGFHAALAILSQIGDIARFANAKKLCSYAGLVPRVYSSGQKEYTGSITKAGRSILRWILVEAAHTTVRYDPELGKFFRRLEKKKGYSVAIVAVARKMLVIIWHLLSGDGPYRHVKVRSYATKLLNWGYKIGKEQRGQKCGAFVLYWLQQVGLDGQIDQLGTGKNICYLRV